MISRSASAVCLVALLGACQKAPPLGAGLRPDGRGPAISQAEQRSLAAEDFLAKAVGADLYAEQAARVAEARAHRPDVKAFARTLAADAAADRETWASAESRTLSRAPLPARPTETQQAMLSLLARDPPLHFDRTYVEQQAQSQEDAMGALTAYAARPDGQPALRAAAQELAPAAEERLQAARALEDSLNAS